MEDFDKSLESFLHHIALSRTGSQDTQDAYHRDVERFLTYLQDKDIHSFEDVKKEDIADYITQLRSGEFTGNKLSNASYARNLSSLKSLYRYLNRQEGIHNNPILLFQYNQYIIKYIKNLIFNIIFNILYIVNNLIIIIIYQYWL